MFGSKKLLHCIFVQPKIPGNTGTTGRTCLALDAQLHLVRPLGFSLDDAHVKRSGLDYWEHVAPTIHDDWDACRDMLTTSCGIKNFLFFTTHSDRQLTDLSLFQELAPPSPTYQPNLADIGYACVFGSETAGLYTLLPHDRLQNQQTVRLPMLSPTIRSLNLAVSAGIGLWEVYRQQNVYLSQNL